MYPCNEIQPVTEIRSDIILYSRIEFWFKWVRHPFSLIKGPKLINNFVTCEHFLGVHSVNTFYATRVIDFPIGTCQVKVQCNIILNLTYNRWFKVHSHTFVPALMLPVNVPLKQLWRQGAPLPFSLTVVSTNKLTITH